MSTSEGREMLRILRCCITTLIVAAGLLPASAYADDVLNGTIYYYDEVVDTGTDTGYSESNTIKESNPHFGWKLGTFSITRFTSVAESNKGYPVFLKTVGDKVKLSFNLDQDINALNGSEALSINDDDNGYDQHFGVAKQDFGRGTLIVRQTNYQNETSAPQVYVNYLDGVEQGAETEVELFEEGDYEVSLNYEIKDDPRKVGPVSIAPEYSNYKIIFKFAVRNGNCMLFPFDLATGNELANESYAPEGFYLDLARSRYLDINVKKEVMAPGTNGLVEDTRFNGPARDGDRYTEDGIYTLTAKNDYTGQETVKKIYVGDDPVLKCYAVTGTPIKEINQRVSDGEVIAENGQLVTPEAAEEIAEDEESHHDIGVLLGVAIALAIIFGIATPIGLRKRRTAQQRELPESGAAQILPSPRDEEDAQ